MTRAVDILVIGGGGQVGVDLNRAGWPDGVMLHTPDRDRVSLDDPTSLMTAVETGGFAAVVNLGAYTAVDRAEVEVAKAFAINATGPAALAEATRRLDIPLIQVSSDYVFDGTAGRPYVEDDSVAPVSVYGASKLAGELAVRCGNPRSVVLRSSWVFGRARSNFVKTMLELARSRSAIDVVADQRGCPTAAGDLAAALRTVTLRLIADPDAPVGTYHFTNAGDATWADLARATFEYSALTGGPTADVRDISTAERPAAAKRPRDSRLSGDRLKRDYGIVARPWREALAEVVAGLGRERKVA